MSPLQKMEAAETSGLMEGWSFPMHTLVQSGFTLLDANAVTVDVLDGVPPLVTSF